MAFYGTDNRLGVSTIATTETTAQQPLGSLCRAYDSTYGEGEFIYLLGVASTVVGSVVTYDATTWQTALMTNTAGQARPVAVAMSANVATQYGWYQIEGLAVVKKTAVAVTPQVVVYASATAGRIKVLTSSGMQILGARTANLATVAAGTSTVIVLINRPHQQGQIT